MADDGAASSTQERTLEYSRTERGTTWRGLKLTDDGGLAIQGQDFGRMVEGFYGSYEYEFTRALSAAETSTLRGLLAVSEDGDLLAAIAERFSTSHALEGFLTQHGITGEFWSRVGD